MAGRVHYPLLLMLQFFFTNLTFLSGKISGDTQGVIQHPSGDVYYLEFFNLDIDTVTKHNVWSRQILEPNLIHILCIQHITVQFASCPIPTVNLWRILNIRTECWTVAEIWAFCSVGKSILFWELVSHYMQPRKENCFTENVKSRTKTFL